jgi:hypothetical protein
MRERVEACGGTLPFGPRLGRLRRARSDPTSSGCRHVIRVVLADDHELVREGLALILDAQDDAEVVGQAVRTAGTGEVLIAPTATRRLVEQAATHRHRSPPSSLLSDLTERELDVLRAIARGLSNAERGDRAAVSSRALISALSRRTPTSAGHSISTRSISSTSSWTSTTRGLRNR